MEILNSLLDSPAPEVGIGTARDLAGTLFGVRGTVRRLAGERAQNFHIVTSDDGEWVLKVAHPRDTAGVDTQVAALQHLAEHAPRLPVPRPRLPLGPARLSAAWSQVTPDGVAERRVQMCSFLPGRTASAERVGAAQRTAIGRTLALLHEGLSGFDATAAPPSPWNLLEFAAVQRLVRASMPPHVPDEHAGELEHLTAHALPILHELPRQALHNDFNPNNLLLDGDRVSGIIDFGDLVMAPRVQDVAIAAGYRIAADGHPLAGPADLVRGYHRHSALNGGEIALLRDLMAARLLSVLAIAAWRAEQDPSNAAYLLRNVPAARSALLRLSTVGCDEAAAYFTRSLS